MLVTVSSLSSLFYLVPFLNKYNQDDELCSVHFIYLFYQILYHLLTFFFRKLNSIFSKNLNILTFILNGYDFFKRIE